MHKLEVAIASEIAALQYFTRLARCTIECESIVLVCITSIYHELDDKGFDY